MLTEIQEYHLVPNRKFCEGGRVSLKYTLATRESEGETEGNGPEKKMMVS